jgi:hypothetical protein
MLRQNRKIARAFGARTIQEDARNLARIRDAGARAAMGLGFSKSVLLLKLMKGPNRDDDDSFFYDFGR